MRCDLDHDFRTVIFHLRDCFESWDTSKEQTKSKRGLRLKAWFKRGSRDVNDTYAY